MTIPLFALGIINSTKPCSRAEQMSNITRLKNPNWAQADLLALYNHG